MIFDARIGRSKFPRIRDGPERARAGQVWGAMAAMPAPEQIVPELVAPAGG